MTNFTNGLAWHRIDLHVHTPASGADYQDSSITPEQFVQKAIAAGLNAIAVTDHNTAAWVDSLKQAAQGKSLTIFPGVEITAQGGRKNIHILAVFDPSKTTANVHDLLSDLALYEDKRGRTESLASGDINTIINHIHQHGAMAFLAHSDSTSGVFADLEGQPRIQIVQNPNLMGAQILHDATKQFLDGNDPNYKRDLATFRASDAHHPGDIGRDYSLFKIGSLTLHGLRQCFLDPRLRIKDKEFRESTYAMIGEIQLSSGFFAGQSTQFHAGLNSIIGGKGVGKSLLLEFLRFALDHVSDVTVIKNDMMSKVARRLGVGGKVTVRITSAQGIEYIVSRLYDNQQNPITITNVADGGQVAGDISRLFPIMVYSQNEIIYIADDPSVQLKLIDRIVGVDSFDGRLRTVRELLATNKDNYIQSMSASDSVDELNREIGTLKAKIAELDKALSDEMFTLKRKWDVAQDIVRALETRASSTKPILEKFIQDNFSVGVSPLDDSVPVDEALAKYHTSLTQVITEAKSGLDAVLATCEELLGRAATAKEPWNTSLQKWDEEFSAFVEKAGGEFQALANQRTALMTELAAKEQVREHLQKQADDFPRLKAERDGLLDQVDGVREELRNARLVVYKQLASKSNGKLRLTLQPDADRESYFSGLEAVVARMGFQRTDLRTLVQALTPRDLVQLTLEGNLADIRQHGQLTPGAAAKFVNEIKAEPTRLADLLALAYSHPAVDVPVIEFKKDDGNYYPLTELSVGQKCTALMLIALADGTTPIVIDQPEDALDVATIYYDVVQGIRDSKHQRQFILTTHNSNIAVSSDSDKFHVLRGTANSGAIFCCGSVDEDIVREAVLDHLEGGPVPYTLRGKKLRLN